MSTQLARRWFADYDASRTRPVNRVINWITVPVILFCLLGFAWSAPQPVGWENNLAWFKWSFVAIALLCLVYARLSLVLAVGLLACMALCNEGLLYFELHTERPIWKICLVPFVVAVVAQWIGNRFEKKPLPFFKSLLFLLIGPAWLLSLPLRRVGLKY